ncbi:hypothetical protein M1403_03015 [Patescibacteria group bacterium]|nr:hypothetical protein [Patescibacteria group bacterium]
MLKAPKKTTVWTSKINNPKGEIYFPPELIEFVKAKKKSSTYRYGNKYDYLNIGDTIIIRENNKPEPSYKAVITGKKKTFFKDLPLTNPGHEAPENKEHQRQILSGYYAYLGRSIADDDPFIIIDFELI